MEIYIMAIMSIALLAASMILCGITAHLKARTEQLNKKLSEL